MHRDIIVCEQAMGTYFLDTRALGNVLNIVFPLVNLIQVFFNGTGNELRSIAFIGLPQEVLILITVLGLRELLQEFVDHFLLGL